MSNTENFHDLWKSFLAESESKSNPESLSEIDIAGAIGAATKKLAGMGARPKDRSMGGRTSMKGTLATPEEMPPQQTALVVRTVGEIEKASSPNEVANILKSDLFTALHNSNPDTYDLVLNSISKEQSDLISQALLGAMLTENQAAFRDMLDALKIKFSRVEPLINRITGYLRGDSRKQLLSLDVMALREEEDSFAANLTRRLSQMFQMLRLQYQKYILGQTLIKFWEIVIKNNTYEVSGDAMTGLQTIAKIQTDWIKNNIDLEEVDASRNKNRSNIKKAANKPEVRALLSTQS